MSEQHVRESVQLLDLLHQLHDAAESRAEDPPPCWPGEDLHAARHLARVMHARLLGSADDAIRTAYFKLRAEKLGGQTP